MLSEYRKKGEIALKFVGQWRQEPSFFSDEGALGSWAFAIDIAAETLRKFVSVVRNRTQDLSENEMRDVALHIFKEQMRQMIRNMHHRWSITSAEVTQNERSDFGNFAKKIEVSFEEFLEFYTEIKEEAHREVFRTHT